MNFDKKNITALTYLVVFVVLIVVLFFSYKTYIKYKASNTLYNSADDNVNETLLIKDWTSGNSAPITPTTIMPQSMIPSEYSISFLIYLNDLQETDTNIDQLIFIKGTPDDSELTLSIKSLRYNPHSDLRFTCKLQIDVETTDINDLLNNTNNNNNNNNNNTETDADNNTAEQFSNTGSNSNRVHNKIGSNVIDYFTVQNIYSNETFKSISTENFQATSDNTETTETAAKIEQLKTDISAKIKSLEEYKAKATLLLNKIDDIVKDSTVNQSKETAIELNNKITATELQDIDTTEKNVPELTKMLKEINTISEDVLSLYNQIKKIEEELSGSTKNDDFVELPNTSTQKVLHICLVIRDDIMDIYKNGMLESSKVLDSFPLINNGKFTFFPDQNKAFNGSLNKFTYFNRALNHNDVVDNYKKHATEINRDTHFTS